MMRWILILLAGWIAAAPVCAQEVYPSRLIRIIVAYPPGGAVDIMARITAQKIQETLGQPVVVENRGGAGGVIGTQAVARAAPDGYTLLVVDRGTLTINPSLHKVPPYDAVKDFAYTGVSAELHYVLVVTAASPAKSLREFVQLAKSKPGSLNYGAATGSIIHLNFERMNSQLGIQVTHVPYKGAADSLRGAVSGDVALTMSSYAGVSGFLRDGRLRGVAVSSSERLPQLPHVPTVSEAGGGSDAIVPTYFTYVVPAGTPRAVIAKLSAELGRAQLAPDVMEGLIKAGLEPKITTPEAITESVKRDTEHFGKLIKAVGITLQ